MMAKVVQQQMVTAAYSRDHPGAGPAIDLIMIGERQEVGY